MGQQPSSEGATARAAMLEQVQADLGFIVPQDPRYAGDLLASREVDFIIAVRGVAGLVTLASAHADAVIGSHGGEVPPRALDCTDSAGWVIQTREKEIALVPRRSTSPAEGGGRKVLLAWLLLATATSPASARGVDQAVRCVLSALNPSEDGSFAINVGMYASLAARMDELTRLRAAVDLSQAAARLETATGLECPSERRHELERIVHRVTRGFPFLTTPTSRRPMAATEPNELFADRIPTADGARESAETFLLRVHGEAVRAGLDAPSLRAMDPALYQALARTKNAAGRSLLSVHLAKGVPGPERQNIDRTRQDRDQARLRMRRLRARSARAGDD